MMAERFMTDLGRERNGSIRAIGSEADIRPAA
jgi:hypothetical protein